MKKRLNVSFLSFIILFFIISLNCFSQSVTISHIAGPIILNEPVYGSLHHLNLNRGLFADVIVRENSVWTTYQIAPDTSLSYGKSVWYKKFDRNLNLIQGQTKGIDVFSDTLFNDDLGDHQFTLMNDTIYTVAIIKNHNKAGVMKYDTSFNRCTDPIYVGDSTTDIYFDMGIGNDGNNIYTQFHYKPDSIQENWGAKVYKLNRELDNVIDSVIAFPDTGSFVTGTSIVYTPNGELGATEDKLNIFSTDRMYYVPSLVNIHTFSIRPDLTSITGSTQVIIAEDKDVYWPCGVSANYKHDLWVVGYTKEITLDTFAIEELGASFIKIFDANWNVIDSFSLNNGDSTFRVMTETIDDDIYVVYDEMNKGGSSDSSNTKIEHFKINSTVSNFNDREDNSKKISIYPNPVSELIYISCTEQLRGATIRLINSNGQIIIEKIDQYGINFNLNIKDQPTGIYFIEIQNNENIVRTKIIKE